MSAPNPRPYARAARDLCPETNHDEVWFCPTCRALEKRLEPIAETLKGVLKDADLSITVDNRDAYGGQR